MKTKKARIIALYLPQFHPVPENDNWWGKGFTEWTNVGKAKPLFRGHYQPRVPADLGYYDLRMPEIREQQAELAKEAGIEGFCYWHYWFGNGKQLLERPFNEVLESGKPDFPFCLGWANHSWTNKNWNVVETFTKSSNLIEQTYPGEKDNIDHFNYLLPAFKDKRYITIDDKPIFVIYKPLDVPDVSGLIKLWNKLAIENGLKGIYFIGISENFELIKDSTNKKERLFGADTSKLFDRIYKMGFDGIYSRGMNRSHIKSKSFLSYYFYKFFSRKTDLWFGINKYEYKKVIEHLNVPEEKQETVFPTIISGWDRTPRSGKTSIVWHNFTPDLFKKHVKETIKLVENKKPENRIVFLQSWNEWAEGNYVEPDLKYGKKLLNSIKEVLTD